MRALFIGVGSIGKRHIKDFYDECKKNGEIPEIYTLRRKISDLGELSEYVSGQLTELGNDKYDVVFITNPTNLHYQALIQCKGKTKFYFIEKPIFENTDYDFENLGISSENSYIACPMRHTLTYKTLKEIVNKHKVFSARIICSSYLPEWRQDIDYRKNYSAIKEMGGGVTLDLIHEIDYLMDLFGKPEEVYNFRGTYSDLEISSDDLSVYIMKFKNMLCEVHLDYFGRKATRICEIYTHEGTYIADFYGEKIVQPDGNVKDCHVEKDEEFKNEMRYFYRFITGKNKSINNPQHAFEALKLSLGGNNNE